MIAVLIVSLLLFFAEIVFIRTARRSGLSAIPVSRSSHTVPTVSGAGIIFPLGIFACTALFQPRYAIFTAGLALLSAVSFADDIRPISAGRRFAVQGVAALLMLLQGLPSGYSQWWALFALFCILAIVNAYNFMDGINGITGLYTLAVLLPLICINRTTPFITPEILYVTLAATLIFLFFNCRRRAVCFCGDVGSVSLGYILAFATLLLILRTFDLSYIALFLVYGVDTAATLVRRALRRENLATAHRMHAYQLLANELRIPHIAVATIYALLQLLISAGLLYSHLSPCIYLPAVTVALLAAYAAVVQAAGKRK